MFVPPYTHITLSEQRTGCMGMESHLWLRVLLVHHGRTQDFGGKKEEVAGSFWTGSEQRLRACEKL